MNCSKFHHLYVTNSHSLFKFEHSFHGHVLESFRFNFVINSIYWTITLTRLLIFNEIHRNYVNVYNVYMCDSIHCGLMETVNLIHMCHFNYLLQKNNDLREKLFIQVCDFCYCCRKMYIVLQ